MSLLSEKVATATDNKLQLRLEKALQHIDLVRTGPLSLLLAGLLAGLPETISLEVTHPVRDRYRACDAVLLSHLALWAQHGRGQIVELAPATVRQHTDSTGYVQAGGSTDGVSSALPSTAGGGDSVVGNQLYKLRTRYYLNDNGAIEVLADDHLMLEIGSLIAGAKYQVYAPEMPVVAATANMFTSFDMGLILKTDRERNFAVRGKSGMILPNRPDIIERVILTYDRANGTTESKEYEVEELMATQADINPNIATLNYTSPDATLRSTLFMPSDTADLLVIDFGAGISAVQIDTVLGSELRYSIVSQESRP